MLLRRRDETDAVLGPCRGSIFLGISVVCVVVHRRSTRPFINSVVNRTHVSTDDCEKENVTYRSDLSQINACPDDDPAL